MARKKSYQRGSVQLREGIWSLRYREFDHDRRKWIPKREKLGKFKTRKDALRAAEPIMARVNERNNNPAPQKRQADITFKQFVEGRWKAYTLSAKHQPSTAHSYGSLTRNHLLPRFGDRRLRDITPADISDFLDSQREKLSTNTMHVLYALLRVMFDLAEQLGLVEKTPVRPKLHRPETAKVEKPTLTAAEIRQVLAAMPEGERLFTLLIAVTGARLGETLALRWQDFDAERCELRINHTLYRGELKQPKTESSRRPLRLAPAVAELLVLHKRESSFQAATDFIFCRADSGPLSMTVLRRHLYKAMDTAKIGRAKGKHGFHIFRHTAGSLIYAKSRDLKLVQSTLGHTTISMTSDLYVHLSEKVIGEGTEILADEILGNCVQTVTRKRKRAG